MKNLNRHIKAGAIAGLVFPVYWIGKEIVWYKMNRPWDYDGFIIILEIIILVLGGLAGSMFGALIAFIEAIIEKKTSKRLSLFVTILPALIAGFFIAIILSFKS